MCSMLIVGMMACNAQGFIVNDLIGTKWECNNGVCIESYKFTNDSILETYYFIYSNTTVNYAKPFYLAKNKTESFDFSKVGTETSGRFLLYYNDKMNETEYWEITKQTPDTLILFHEAQDGYVGVHTDG